MPREITVVLPSSGTDRLVSDLRELGGLLTLQVQRGSSVVPAGDVVRAQFNDRAMPRVLRTLDRFGAGTDSGVSVTISEPVGMIGDAATRDAVSREPAIATLEESEYALSRESTMDANKLPVMFFAGVIAAVGIATGSVHVVVGAMVIAPGFEPMLRVVLGIVGRSRVWRYGLLNLALGYGALVVGAVTATLALSLFGLSMLPVGPGGYLDPGSLVDYWSSMTLTGTVVAVAAGLAGALLVTSSRSVLTAGVMIALALIPSAALAGMALVAGEPRIAAGAALRWLHDVVVVVACGFVVLGAKYAGRWRRLRV
ncbi:MAG TPA: DUF389 domain-containing protein [Micromonosporaceae bacterium]